MERMRAHAVAAAALVAALALGVSSLIPDLPRARANPRSFEDPPVVVDGREIDLGGDLRSQAVDIARHWLSQPIRLSTPHAAEQAIADTRRGIGATVDVERLVRLLAAAKDPRSPMRRVHAQTLGTRPLRLPLCESVDHERLMETLVALKDEVDRVPQNARVDTQTRSIVPHRDGVRVDVWATLDAVEEALDAGGRDVEIVTRVLPANRDAEAVGEIAMDTVLGTFRTRYSPTEEAEDRTFNLRVAAAKLDGIVVLPGEELDFNEVVGERTEANGFRMAPVIASGELADGVGGGTCQISGTLHAAVFFAGLPIVDRNPHSRPSFYIKLGLDAMVAYPQMSFRFKNDRPFPVVVAMTVEDAWVTATLWGAESHHQVSFVRRIDETTAFEEVERPDADLPTGVRVLEQRGIPGFELRRWRIVRDVRTNQAVRERLSDVYPPTTQIWRVGTGGPVPEGYDPPGDDDHPEYTADAFLSMTQGAGIDGTLEQRRAGRTGVAGWTVRAGYTDQLAGSVAGE
jgi:vancomycin resistance protein YoaR